MMVYGDSNSLLYYGCTTCTVDVLYVLWMYYCEKQAEKDKEKKSKKWKLKTNWKMEMFRISKIGKII